MRDGTLLPRLILIGDRFTDPAVQERILRAADAGVPWVHLRDHEAGGAAFETAASEITRRLPPGTMVSVNARLNVAAELGLHFHTGRLGPSVSEAREALGAQAVVGFSAHDLVEGAEAARPGVDYLIFSPVYDTAKSAGVGIEALRRFISGIGVPVYALGGITPDRCADCLEAGAHGVAVLSGILNAPEAARSYLAELE